FGLWLAHRQYPRSLANAFRVCAAVSPLRAGGVLHHRSWSVFVACALGRDRGRRRSGESPCVEATRPLSAPLHHVGARTVGARARALAGVAERADLRV